MTEVGQARDRPPSGVRVRPADRERPGTDGKGARVTVGDVVRRAPERGLGLVDRAVARTATMPAWVAALGLAVLLVGAWVATYASGGTQRALPHLFYIPIIASVLPFGWRGTLLTAFAAGVLCGPFMPMDADTGEPQQLGSWLFRGVMFLLVGAAAAAARTVRERLTEQQLSTEVASAMHRSDEVDEALVPLVPDVLAGHRFHPVFQPVYSLTDGHLIAVEALTRFDAEPARTPDVWFRAADRAGLGTELEVAAVAAALDAVAELPPDVAVSLNASPATLGDPRLRELLAAHPERRVILEITEHAVVEDYHLLLGSVDELRALGVRIAVDDAGAGFSSLRHIVQLGPDTIKLDISLTQGVGTSALRRALAGALIDFAQRTGAELIVEGIEEVGDLTTWSALGADAAQGYLTGRPGPLPAAAQCAAITSLRGVRV